MRDIIWKKTRTETIVNDKWIDFRANYYIMPDGEEIGPFYTYHKQDYAVIVATDEEGNYICVNQFRQGLEEVTTEFVAGGIEGFDGTTDRAGNPAVEESKALAAAKRELREESGYESDEWEHLMTIPSSATINDNYAHIYRAKNCRLTSEQELDSTEFINVTKLSEAELDSMIGNGEFKQAIHVLAWYLAKDK